ncbi:MAG: putative toxin-antitoxin system toxin component, PIN family [Candidatus Eisenbacteria bacterium]|uniref:Toxin-antitoxin system toxin component, PIN family n=1 Tax=Eiseniibacteriota bacterium TaxID=2212470 RepID=A0A948RXN4_UNCEI|nr:putative toxin-antitoxin system toxin component, PIN family [Candidatus Eisenbacteria bacterium]MBU2692930.1 putative toxin-antitoxin system toxin component, PIN family [Candidatus Eisenbacteria bacterium]
MRIVLDTNVLVSGVFFTGPPFKILEAWRDGKVEIVMSKEIFQEYQRVGEILSEEFSGVDIAPFLSLLLVKSKFYDPPELKEPVCDDPSDDKFLACALAARCKLIISGDKHLLRVTGYRGIEVLRPREFLDGRL